MSRWKVLSKRTLAWLLAGSMVFSLVPVGSSHAAAGAAVVATEMTAQVGDFEYSVDDYGNAVITGYSGEAAAVTIPDELGGHKVTGIGDSAFLAVKAWRVSRYRRV